jgi:hypothetical protein
MAIDHNVCAAARLYEDQPIGPLEDALLGALEDHDQTYAAWESTRKALTPLFAHVLSAWIYPGAEIDIYEHTKGRPRCLLGIKVGHGNARGAARFRIVGKLGLTVDDRGDPSMSRWSVRAVAISPKTGKDMSANTPNGHGTDGTVTLNGNVFSDGDTDLTGQAFLQHERDMFMKMVEQAEAILVERKSDTSPALAEAGIAP